MNSTIRSCDIVWFDVKYNIPQVCHENLLLLAGYVYFQVMDSTTFVERPPICKICFWNRQSSNQRFRFTGKLLISLVCTLSRQVVFIKGGFSTGLTVLFRFNIVNAFILSYCSNLTVQRWRMLTIEMKPDVWLLTIKCTFHFIIECRYISV